MKPRAPTLIVCAALLALAGCHGAVQKTDNQRTAEGQVLKGSISDAMLPYDAVTSEPPIAAPRPVAAPDAAEATDTPSEAASASTDTPAPAGSSDAPVATTSPAA